MVLFSENSLRLITIFLPPSSVPIVPRSLRSSPRCVIHVLVVPCSLCSLARYVIHVLDLQERSSLRLPFLTLICLCLFVYFGWQVYLRGFRIGI
jgi:hypothetical protein